MSVEQYSATPRQLTFIQGLASRLVSILDPLARALAWAASKVSPVCDAGVFYYPDHPALPLTVWSDACDLGGRSCGVRLGRVEFLVDLQGRNPALCQ
jgi:hypothetical protein